jgi:hypothetical protein
LFVVTQVMKSAAWLICVECADSGAESNVAIGAARLGAQATWGSVDKALAAFLAWLSSNGHALRGGNLDLRPEDAAALSGLAGEPLVDLRYRFDGRNLVALVIGRLADLQQLGIMPELTGSLAAPLLAASQNQEKPLP